MPVKQRFSMGCYVENAQGTLRRAEIDLLPDIKKAAEAANAYKEGVKGAKPLSNLTWALNSHDGIHSIEYAKEVYKRLAAADKRGPEAVRRALEEMGRLLSEGKKFW